MEGVIAVAVIAALVGCLSALNLAATRRYGPMGAKSPVPSRPPTEPDDGHRLSS